MDYSATFYKYFLVVFSVGSMLGLGDVNKTKARTLQSKSVCSSGRNRHFDKQF